MTGAETEPELELVNSPLEREITINGTTVKICIYRSETETSWLLEVEDHLGGSTVWDDRFATDKEALDAAMAAIDEDGIESMALASVLERESTTWVSSWSQNGQRIAQA
jgi:hypothetical protein